MTRPAVRRRGCAHAHDRDSRAARRELSQSSYRRVSSISSSRSAAGSKRMIWRHSSAPMEPAAPVTATTLPRIVPATPSVSIGVSSRPSRSSTSTLRRSRRLTEPLAMTISGMTRVCTPASAAALSTRRAISLGAEGSATTTSSISRSRTTPGSSDVVPSTGTPPMVRRLSAGSSSRKPTAVRPRSGRFWISRSKSDPALPAPTMSPRRPLPVREARRYR